MRALLCVKKGNIYQPPLLPPPPELPPLERPPLLPELNVPLDLPLEFDGLYPLFLEGDDVLGVTFGVV